MGAANRSPEEIRQSVEAAREELRVSLTELQGRVTELSDWRQQLRENREKALPAAAGTGFVVGGGIGAFLRVFRRPKS